MKKLLLATLCASSLAHAAETTEIASVWAPMVKSLVQTHIVKPMQPEKKVQAPMFSRSRLPVDLETHTFETTLGPEREGIIPFTVTKKALLTLNEEGEVVEQGYFKLTSKELCTKHKKKKRQFSCRTIERSK